MELQRWESCIAEGNTPHAIVIAGNRGTGKRVFAQRLAMRYLGLAEESALSDSPYYRESEEFSVESVRVITRFVNFGAYGKGRRCVVFFDAHRLSAQAQNALLKSLEEPPEDTLFLLTGNEAGLLPTIRSRCMTLRMGAKPLSDTAKELEAAGIAAARAQLAAALSGGVVGLAREYAAEEYMAFRAGALEQIENLLFHVPPYTQLAALLSVPLEGGGNPPRSASEGGKESKKKKASVQAEPLRQFFTILQSILRDALAAQAGGGDARNTDCVALKKKLAARFTNGQLQRMIQRVFSAEQHLHHGGNAGMVLDWLLAGIHE